MSNFLFLFLNYLKCHLIELLLFKFIYCIKDIFSLIDFKISIISFIKPSGTPAYIVVIIGIPHDAAHI